jgi:hypothetical protein
MPPRQAVTEPSLYLHAHMDEVQKSPPIHGVPKFGHLSAWKMQSQGLVIYLKPNRPIPGMRAAW